MPLILRLEWIPTSDMLEILNLFRTEHELEPNCLLTRWPIVFAYSPTTKNSYLSLAKYLSMHGYEVFEWTPEKFNLAELQSVLQKHNKFCHLFIQNSWFEQISGHRLPNFLKSSTSISTECTKSDLLILAKNLAEQDFVE